MQYLPSQQAYKSGEWHKKFNTVNLEELWGIGVKWATYILESTIKHGAR